ncbi:uncharacterized protein TNIN_93951 [Trichonephila inaurata madagascariensis]|uniref:Uncharacterized protein n=1 Tax=Trichonephila inaurata madagascariensis TaxID=2747483 RepID=A0A8X7BXT4_9ARAC|nr:uncharacterized protein TNIN_93951 [Trichonephila inaurata madagascariensis]
MRNLILFQISNREDFKYFNKAFHHQFRMKRECFDTFSICFTEAFNQVAKSHVLVHNYEPFCNWNIIIVDDDGHPQTQDEDYLAAKTGKKFKRGPTDKYLVATCNDDLVIDPFPNCPFKILSIRTNTSYQLSSLIPICTNSSFDVMHEFTWRRVYDANSTFFFCEDNDFSHYIWEQIRKRRPINVFKTIKGREIGNHFDQKLVLKTIASPYYYILPHQDEEEFAEYERKGESHWEFTVWDFITFRFLSQLEIAVKNVA